MKTIKELVNFIYAGKETKIIYEDILSLIKSYKTALIPLLQETSSFDQKDSIVITYANTLHPSKGTSLRGLKDFADNYLKDCISGIHILPFCPYSSDDGFSIIDYRKVKEEWGNWDDIRVLSKDYKLMFDLVLNHCSRESDWFKGFLNDNSIFKDYFISVDPEIDLSRVFRPRALPLLTQVQAKSGKKSVWTTFSEDQVDLNFDNPRVLLEFLDILLFYITQGARIIRLDAIAFLWKEIGTSCLHHPKTHAVVQLFRSVLEDLTTGTILITETNVPHKDNISYFGEGDNEAQYIYQFPLPPLTLDTFIREDASYLTQWAETLPHPDGKVSFFNFLASHDGIGVLPARDYLTDKEMKNLIDTVVRRGGFVSLKSTPTGDIPYELNINYFDALTSMEQDEKIRVKAFMASQAIILSMAGLPGIYIHSLIGSTNWNEGFSKTGNKRSINRESLSLEEVESELKTPGSRRNLIYSSYKELLKIRSKHPAFSPSAGQDILNLSPSVFSLVRRCDEETLFVIINVTSKEQFVKVPDIALVHSSHPALLTCLMNPECLIVSENRYLEISLEPYEIKWMNVGLKVTPSKKAIY